MVHLKAGKNKKVIIKLTGSSGQPWKFTSVESPLSFFLFKKPQILISSLEKKESKFCVKYSIEIEIISNQSLQIQVISRLFLEKNCRKFFNVNNLL
jgi:hypothetical protein